MEKLKPINPDGGELEKSDKSPLNIKTIRKQRELGLGPALESIGRFISDPNIKKAAISDIEKQMEKHSVFNGFRIEGYASISGEVLPNWHAKFDQGTGMVRVTLNMFRPTKDHMGVFLEGYFTVAEGVGNDVSSAYDDLVENAKHLT